MVVSGHGGPAPRRRRHNHLFCGSRTRVQSGYKHEGYKVTNSAYCTLTPHHAPFNASRSACCCGVAGLRFRGRLVSIFGSSGAFSTAGSGFAEGPICASSRRLTQASLLKEPLVKMSAIICLVGQHLTLTPGSFLILSQGQSKFTL